MPNTKDYRSQELFRNIINPRNRLLNDTEKIAVLWAVLKTWIRSVYDVRGVIR
ncbi:MAG: hypothetical protein H6765_06035 [Candidatus Peribacteria bacterium]|nr:MAG: hypothetical protein H6765_06035 [Candidatus Peribacteria bacterium]